MEVLGFLVLSILALIILVIGYFLLRHLLALVLLGTLPIIVLILGIVISLIGRFRADHDLRVVGNIEVAYGIAVGFVYYFLPLHTDECGRHTSAVSMM